MMTPSVLQDQTIRDKVDALLSDMSLDQKIGQMTQAEQSSVTPEDVRDYHLGAILSGAGSSPGDNLPKDWVSTNDAYWAASMFEDERHLAIPVIYGVDAIHGHHNVRGATIFPHNIGLGATGDPGLIRRVATVVPAIVAGYAGEFVHGLQRDLGTDGLVACAKHWVGDGGTTHGIDQGETTLSIAELKRIHVKPYLPAIDAGLLSIMASFSSWNGDKCHGHKYLLTDVLKNELQFDGYIVSDWDGIDYLSEDYHSAVALAVNAGIDMFMISDSWKEFIMHLKRHVARGSVAMQRVDDAVRRILTVKFAFGLFDKPRPAERFWSNHDSYGCREHRSLAREAVRKSLVLLKNENSLLPLNKNARILVAGKNANNLGHQCGGFSITLQGVSGNELIEHGTSIWAGIKEVAAKAELSSDPYGDDADPDRHEVAIIIIGERPYAEGLGDIRDGDHLIVEAGSQINGSINVLEPYGNTLELAQLHPEDLRVIKTITAKGIPAIVILVSGRPLVVGKELDESAAFVSAWLPGSEGQGIADVLFGDFDFEGKLSFCWPESDDYPSATKRNLKPLFPLGYGLTYSNTAKRS
jgi:beta-glucosidase